MLTGAGLGWRYSMCNLPRSHPYLSLLKSMHFLFLNESYQTVNITPMNCTGLPFDWPTFTNKNTLQLYTWWVLWWSCPWCCPWRTQFWGSMKYAYNNIKQIILVGWIILITQVVTPCTAQFIWERLFNQLPIFRIIHYLLPTFGSRSVSEGGRHWWKSSDRKRCINNSE